jgi:D-alanyl-D-alanine carboxypeptidase
MMTLYLLFDAIESGRVRLSDAISFSGNAAAQPPSKLGVYTGERISVENAILALVTKSANDVAAAVAEHLGGSEYNFAQSMTERFGSAQFRSGDNGARYGRSWSRSLYRFSPVLPLLLDALFSI